MNWILEVPLFAKGGEETQSYWRNRVYPEGKRQRKRDLASVNLKKEKERVKEWVALKGSRWPRVNSARWFKALVHGVLVTGPNNQWWRHDRPCTAGLEKSLRDSHVKKCVWKEKQERPWSHKTKHRACDGWSDGGHLKRRQLKLEQLGWMLCELEIV